MRLSPDPVHYCRATSVPPARQKVISERVRDKIAAAKAKGMRMGGQVPPGTASEISSWLSSRTRQTPSA